MPSLPSVQGASGEGPSRPLPEDSLRPQTSVHDAQSCLVQPGSLSAHPDPQDVAGNPEDSGHADLG